MPSDLVLFVMEAKDRKAIEVAKGGRLDDVIIAHLLGDQDLQRVRGTDLPEEAGGRAERWRGRGQVNGAMLLMQSTCFHATMISSMALILAVRGNGRGKGWREGGMELGEWEEGGGG